VAAPIARGAKRHRRAPDDGGGRGSREHSRQTPAEDLDVGPKDIDKALQEAVKEM